jgi:hypothetical protein
VPVMRHLLMLRIPVHGACKRALISPVPGCENGLWHCSYDRQVCQMRWATYWRVVASCIASETVDTLFAHFAQVFMCIR